MAPRGANFVVVSLTDSTTPPSASRSAKDRSRIEQYALDLCGIAATGETLRCHGWLDLMSVLSGELGYDWTAFLDVRKQ